VWGNRAFATTTCSALGHSLNSGTRRSLTLGAGGYCCGKSLMKLLLPILCRSCQGFYVFMDFAGKNLIIQNIGDI
jgi:hypothetical protein